MTCYGKNMRKQRGTFWPFSRIVGIIGKSSIQDPNCCFSPLLLCISIQAAPDDFLHQPVDGKKIFVIFDERIFPDFSNGVIQE
ncbi:hypothetical protein ABH15_09410 [Methanoculleus taiwanensis]|uniref:Uncharacterized protein n=1 Tax=Methanoculleus taiwanensis TaxID=1550565 RepID=A0A498H2J9_9EURY|nr:hypothetical protein ABH15_09410 [Methanoculleus taiwanensis]